MERHGPWDSVCLLPATCKKEELEDSPMWDLGSSGYACETDFHTNESKCIVTRMCRQVQRHYNTKVS